jgi:tyrosyl-tRNA synthetase
MRDMTIDEVLTRGVADILPSKKELADLMRQRKITLYQGFDPTGPSLHLGHFIGIRKLAQFQNLGHKVIFLVGDFTAMIGDPTDKTAARKKLSRKKVLKNLKDYKAQAEKALKFTGPNAAEIKFNSEWLSKLNFEDILELSSHFTVQQMLERDMFQERLKKQKPIYLHELMYPLTQAYDCVVMDVDLEIGGNDQLFNMLAGRTLRKTLKKKEKFVLTTKLLEDPTGKKMGKTEGNVINLNEAAGNMFGKIMAFPDNLIKPGIELLTDLSLESIDDKNPMKAKKQLAFEIVKQIHGESKAKAAQEEFEKTFQKRTPKYQEEIPLQESFAKTVALASGASISQAKRWIQQGAVDVNKKTIKDLSFKLQGGEKLKIGKKRFVRVKR